MRSEPPLQSHRPPRILFIGHEASRTGAPIALLRLMRWARENTPSVMACILQQGGELAAEFQALCPTVVADDGDWNSHAWRHRLLGRVGLPRLAPWLHSRPVRAQITSADVVYANTLDTARTFRLAYGQGNTLISHVHELEYAIRSHVGTDSANEVLRASDRVIACAQAVADNLVAVHGLAPERVDVIHGYIGEEAVQPTTADWREEAGISKEAFVVGAAGQPSWRKGADLFVQLAKLTQTQATGRDVRFAWLGGRVGSYENEQFLHDARLLGLGEKIVHLPSRDDPMAFFRGIDLFALPSREDPYPLVCLEAASCGVPILCFEGAGGMPEFVEDDAGLVVPYLDLSAMAGAILRLHDDAALRRKMGDAARRKVLERHQIATAGPKIFAAIQTAWEGRRQ